MTDSGVARQLCDTCNNMDLFGFSDSIGAEEVSSCLATGREVSASQVSSANNGVFERVFSGGVLMSLQKRPGENRALD
jgi:hypothetical protein